MNADACGLTAFLSLLAFIIVKLVEGSPFRRVGEKALFDNANVFFAFIAGVHVLPNKQTLDRSRMINIVSFCSYFSDG